MNDEPARLTWRQRTRRGLQWPVVVWLTVVWLLLWGEVTVVGVVSGVVVALLALVAFPLPPIAYSGKVHPLALTWLAVRFGWDLVVASVHVAYVAIRFDRQPQNAVIAVPLCSRGDLYLLLTAELTSLVPGSLLIETAYEEHTLYLHIFDVPDASAVERARTNAHKQEERVVLALASPEEIRDFRTRAAGGTP